MHKRALFSCFAFALVAACGSDKGDTNDTATGDTDAGTTEMNPTETTEGETTEGTGTPGTGTTEGTGTTGTGTTGTDTGDTDEPTITVDTTGDPADWDALSVCAVSMVCKEFEHGAGEAFPHPDDSEGFHDVERCILTGLRDGTPGRYMYGVNTAAANGSSLDRVQFIIHADRQVTFAEHKVGDFFDPGDPQESNQSEIFTQAQTCTITEAAFFDDCFENHDDLTHYGECMPIGKWWSGCVEMGPRCGA